jgi:hypothetical protein
MERDQKTNPSRDKGHDDADAELDRRLDEGLEETFPGSDPVNVTQPQRRAPKIPSGKPRRR